MYSDTDWHNVFIFQSAIENVYEVEYVHLKNGRYYHYMQDSDIPPYREYNVTIKTSYGYLTGNIICCSAGTIEEPFKRYDMLINLCPESKDFESFDE